MISLTDDGCAQIQAFADAHNITISATIESLALIEESGVIGRSVAILLSRKPECVKDFASHSPNKKALDCVESF